jgi:hypothetical protein
MRGSRFPSVLVLAVATSLLLFSSLTPALQAGALFVSNTSGNGAMDTLTLPGQVAGNLPANGSLGNDRAVRIGPDGNLYVATHVGSSIERFDFSAGTWSTFATLPSGPFVPIGMTFAADGNLYVSSFGAAQGNDGTIEKFNGTTGAWDSTIVTGLDFPRGLESVGGNLYLANGDIKEYSTAGTLLNALWGIPSATNPRGLTIGPNGNLYAAVIGTAGPDGTVEEFNIATGGVAINTYSDPGLSIALDVAFDDAGFVYVTDVGNGNVQRFTVAGGAYDSGFSYGVTSPDGIVFSAIDLPEFTSFTWGVDSGGDWNAQGNWAPAGIPDGNDVSVEFGAVIGSTRTVFSDTAITVKDVTFGDTDGGTVQQSYVIAGGGNINLESDTGTSTVSVLEGSHQFQAAVNLNNATGVDTAGATTLFFNNALNLNGQVLTKTGGGTMEINNRLATAGGMVDCQAGTCAGSGTVGGDLNNSSATVAPGNSPGILTIDGNYTQGSGGKLAIEIGGQTPGEEHDKLVVTGIASLAGALDVTLINSFTPSNGNAFDILDAGSVTGDFGMLNLPPNFTWDVSTGVLLVGGGFSDFDNSGFWDLPDLNLVLFNWQQLEASLPVEWVNQRPATVGLDSLNLVLFNWQQASSLATVPEPSSLLLWIVGMVSMLVISKRGHT